MLHTLGGLGVLQLLSPLVQGARAEPEGATAAVAAGSEIKAFINKDYQFKVGVLRRWRRLPHPLPHTLRLYAVSGGAPLWSRDPTASCGIAALAAKPTRTQRSSPCTCTAPQRSTASDRGTLTH